MDKKGNAVVQQEMEHWFLKGLECIAGSREFVKGRYILEVLDEDSLPESLIVALQRFLTEIQAYQCVGCLFVFNIPAFYQGQGASAHDVLSGLATSLSLLTDAPPAETLLHGGNLNYKITLTCPVTGQLTCYEDFDAIAFCPQAYDKDDPLYDPLMAAPYPCVNLTSDLFAFAMYVRDSCLKKHHCEVYQLKELEGISSLLRKCADIWQKMAKKTIVNYIAITDTARCPTSLSADDKYWFACHQDPAFAEVEKVVYSHDMPILYTEHLLETWMLYFREGIPPQLLSVTQPGRAR